MDRSNLYNVIHLSLSFLLIFMSYIVAQTFQTSSDYAKNGAFAVGIIYTVFCLSNLALSSYVTQLLGVRLTLIFSSITYVLFIASNIKYNTWTLYISAFLVGLGAALFWTAQGVYVTISTIKHERINSLISSSTQGLMNGIFFGFFQLNQTIGNLTASYLFRVKLDQWIIFTIMTGIASLGVVGFVFLRPVKMPKTTEQHSILATLNILLDVHFLLLIPTMCYNGLSQGFIYAAVPPLIIDKSRKFLIFALFGFCNACSALFFGKLSDFLGRRLLILGIGALANMIIFGLLLIIWKPPLNENRIEIFIIMAICLGIGDAIFTTQLYSILATFYGETRPADAFACYRVFQAGFTALAFVEHVYLSFSTQVLCLIIVLSLSLITLIYEHYGLISLNTGKTIISMQKLNKNKIEVEVEPQIPLVTLPNTA